MRKPTDHLIQSRPLRYLCLAAGVVLSLVSLKFSYEFGRTISQEMGVACGAISILSSFMVSIWLAAREQLSDIGMPHMIKGLSVVAIALMSWDGFTNSMTASFQRHNDIQASSFQLAAFEDKGKSVVDNKARAEDLAAKSKRLDAEMDKLVESKVGGYTVSVRPSAPEVLDGMIAAKQLEVDNESKRGGCKAKCEARTNELAHLTALRALAKQIADNNAEHARVLADIDNLREKKSTMKVETSGANFQAEKAASWLSLASGEASRTPGKLTVAWVEDGLGSLAGIMIMLGSQAFSGLGTATRAQVKSLARRPDDVLPAAHSAANSGGAHQPASFSPREIVRNVIPGVSVQTVAELRQIANPRQIAAA